MMVVISVVGVAVVGIVVPVAWIAIITVSGVRMDVNRIGDMVIRVGEAVVARVIVPITVSVMAIAAVAVPMTVMPVPVMIGGGIRR
jgi:hypothetical protein